MAKTYTSHPIRNYRIGKFQFQNATLTLDSEEEIEKFAALLDSLPPSEKSRIKLINVEAGEAIAKSHVEKVVTQGIDSAVGRASVAPPQVATGKLEDSGKTDEPKSDDSVKKASDASVLGSKLGK